MTTTVVEISEQEELQAFEDLAVEAQQDAKHDCFESETGELFISFIPIGGDRYLPLKKPITTTYVSPTRLRVVDWNVEFDVEDDFRHLIARKYLEMLSKAENDLLSDLEQDEWLKLIQYVDYNEFKSQFEPARYVWAKVVLAEFAPSLLTTDGTILKFLGSLKSMGLNWLQNGDVVSCRVIFTPDNYIENIRDVELIPQVLIDRAESVSAWLGKNDSESDN